MRIRLGTANGLATVDESGHVEWIAKGDVSRIAGPHVVLDGELAGFDLPFSPQCLALSGDDLLIGTEQAHVFVAMGESDKAERVESFDAIPTRHAWYTPWGAPPATRSITLTGDGIPLVNVHVGGVWRGEGVDWEEVIPVDDDTHQVLASADDPALVVVAAAVGFGASHDGGRTFTWTTDGLHDSYCRAVALAEDNVLVTASTGPFTNHAAVYVRPVDSDAPFVRANNGLPEWFADNIDTFQLAASGSIAAIGTGDGQLFVSHDAGVSWRLLADGLDAIRCVTVEDVLLD